MSNCYRNPHTLQPQPMISPQQAQRTPKGNLRRDLACLAGRSVPASAVRSGCTALTRVKGVAENSAARPHEARGPRRFVHCKTIVSREFVCLRASLRVHLRSPLRLRCAHCSGGPASTLACPDLPHSPPAALRVEATFPDSRFPLRHFFGRFPHQIRSFI